MPENLSVEMNEDANRTLEIVLRAVQREAEFKIDEVRIDDMRIQFSTRPSYGGWGEICTAVISPTDQGARVDLSASGRYPAQFLQTSRNKRVLRRLVRLLDAHRS